MSRGELTEAVSVAVRRGGTLLLVKRGRPPSLGLFAFPGGRVEAGESLEDAARRELREETSLVAGPLAYLETIIFAGEGTADQGFRLTVFFCGEAAGEPLAADDADTAGFFNLQDMAGLPLTESTRVIAARLLGGVAQGGET